jgi:hypothetical protein
MNRRDFFNFSAKFHENQKGINQLAVRVYRVVITIILKATGTSARGGEGALGGVSKDTCAKDSKVLAHQAR